MRLIRIAPVLVLFVVSACRDLTLDPPPPRASLNGTLMLEDGTPAAAIELELLRDGERVDTATTDAAGAFVLTNIAPGQVELRIAPMGFVEVVRTLNLAAGATRALEPITLYAILRGNEGDGQIDGKVVVNGGGDVTGAEVEFLIESTQQRVAVAVVGSSGGFSQRLAPNTYTLRASHPFYVSPPALMGIVLAAKEVKDLTAQPLVFQIDPARITGRVMKERDLAPAPVEAVGALITADTGATATTDQAGNFDLGGLPAGRRTLTVTLSGFHDPISVRSVTVLPAEVKALGDVELLLDRGDIRGEVSMKDNTPLRDVTASLDIASADGGMLPDGGSYPYSAAVAPSSEPSKGSFVIKDVPVGTWSVKASRDNYITASSGAVQVQVNRTAPAGLLELVRIQGDFTVDDGDATNTPGFTRTRFVTLRLAGAGSASDFRVSETDPTLASEAFVAFGPLPDGGVTSPTSIPFTLSSGDGTKSLYLQYRDATGNVSGVLSANMVLDTVAPENLSLVLEDGNDFTRATVALLASVVAIDPRGSGVDNVSGVGFVRLAAVNTLDGNGQLIAGRQAYAPNLTFGRPSTLDGPQVVFAQFIDNAGNASALVQDSVVVDTVPPSGSMTIARGARATLGGVTNSPLVDLQLTAAAEPHGGYVQVKFANENAADLSGAVLQRVRSSMAWFIEPTEGARTVHYTLVDAAGNAAGQSSQPIRYDTTAPSGTVTLTSGNPTNSLSATLNVVATDPGGNPLSPTQALTLSEDPAFASSSTVGPMAFTMPGQPFTLSAGEGQRVIYARFRDAAGNDSTATATLLVDQTAPLGSISLEGRLADNVTPSDTITANPVVTVNVQQTGASLIHLGNETLSTCPAAVGAYAALTGTSIAGHTLTGAASPREVRACLRDAAGNSAGPLTATITLDQAAPGGCTLALAGRKVDGSAAPAGKTALRDLNVTISGCVETPTEVFLTEGAVTCTAAAALAWVPFSTTPAYSLVGADGLTQVRGCVRDAAHNTATLTAVPITLDSTPPTVSPAIVIDSGAAFVNLAQVTARGGNIASVVGTAAGATEWGLSETNPPPPASFVTFTGAAADFTFGGTGPRTLYAQFRDDVGNTTSVAQDGIEFDVTPPTGALGVGAPSIALVGTLADGSTSSGTSATASVSVALTVEGASEYLTGNESLVTCPSSGYLPLTPGATSLSGQTLSGAASPRQFRVCFRDAAGNVVGPVTDTIVLDTTSPTGCVLTVNGFKRDLSAAPADRTALFDVSVAVAGCVETPSEIYLSEGTPVCSATSALPWATYAASVPLLLGGGDGVHTVRGCVRDAARNVTTVTADTIVVDTEPPTSASVTINGGAAYLTASQVTAGAATLSITGAATSAVDWAISETSPPSNFLALAGARNLPITVSADGTRTVYAIFRDDLQNALSTPVQDSIVVDTTLPTGAGGVGNPSIALVGVLGDGLSSNSLTASTQVTVQATVEGAFEYVLAEALPSCPATGYTTLLSTSLAFTLGSSQGAHSVRACFRDGAGNVSGPWVSNTLTLDTVAPTGCALTVNGFKRDLTAAPVDRTAVFDVSVGIAGCAPTPSEVFLSEGTPVCSAAVSLPWVSYAATVPLLLAGGDGLHTVRGCVRDAAHNVTSVTLDTITVDTEPPTSPTVSINLNAAYLNASQVTAGAATLSITGAATGAVDWAISETTPPSNFLPLAGARSLPITVSADGTRTVYAIFRDDLQNALTSPVQDTIIVDTTFPTGPGGLGAPSISVTGTLADGLTSTSNAASTQVTVQATVEGASEYVLAETLPSCPGSGYSPLLSSALAFSTGATAGSHTVRACFRDAAGNASGPFAGNALLLDTTAPSGCALTVNGFRRDFSNGPANRTALTDVRVAINSCAETPTDVYLVEGPLSCVSTVSFTWAAYAPPQSFVLASGEGTHTVRGCVRDAAHNVTSVVADDTVLDTLGPSAPTVSINAGAAWINASQVVASSTTLSLTGSAVDAVTWAADENTSPTNFITLAGARNLPIAVSGDSTRTISAIFLDDLLNPSATVSDSITIDTTPPSITTPSLSIDVLSTAPAPVAGFTSTEAVTVTVSGGNNGAFEAFLAQAAASGGCVTTDFNGVASQSVVSTYGFVLTGPEAPKRVCLRYRDAAGNTSGILEDTVTLDKTPPTTPQITNPDQYRRDPDNTLFTANIVAPSSDLNFYTYERLGGRDESGVPITSWSATTPVVGQPNRFNFREINDGGETGVRNEFRLRAKDNAGNTSGESVVVVTADTNAPDPINWRPEWVDNGDSKATFYWRDPATGAVPDLDHYDVFYGSAPTFSDAEAASFANEGVSPVRIPARFNTSLSGLTNGSTAYVRVRGVDFAGNPGEWLPDAGTTPLRLQPGEVSPNEVSVLNLPAAAGKVHRLARQGHMLYVLATSTACAPAVPSDVTVHAINMKELMSPVQKGRANLTWNEPTIAASRAFTDAVNCISDGSNGDLIVSGQWLFVLSATRLRIISLRDPGVLPAPLATIDVGAIEAGSRALSMSLVGDKLVITGRRSVPGFYATVLNLAELYDNAQATAMTGADLLTPLIAAGVLNSSATAATVTRDRLIITGKDVVGSVSPTVYFASLVNPLTALTAPTNQGSAFNLGPVSLSRFPTNGNLAYFSSPTFGLTSFDVTSLWTGGVSPVPGITTAYLGGGQLDLAGHQLYVPEESMGLRVFDFAQPTFPRDVGVSAFGNVSHTLTFGNYGVIANPGQLHFLELASPRGLRTFTTEPGASFHPKVEGGFLYTGLGYLYDLQAGLGVVRPPGIQTPTSTCTLGSTYEEEAEVAARGTGLRVYNLESGTDRAAATINYTTSDTNVASGRVTDVELFGNHLIVAEVRATGVFLEVFRAGKVRNRSGNALNNLLTTAGGDSVGSVQVVNIAGPPGSLVANISVSFGRVAVGLETNDGTAPATGVGNNLYFVELSDLLDDTTLTGTTTVHGPVNVRPSAPFGIDAVNDVAMQGDYAYVATVNGLYIIDISSVMDAAAGTLLPVSPAQVSQANIFVGNAFDGLYVDGSMLLATPGERATAQSYQEGLYSIDVSSPLNPEVQAFLPANATVNACAPLNDSMRRMRTRVTVAGTRAYLTGGGAVRVIDLE